MLELDATTLAELLPYEDIILALDNAFRSDASVPERQHYNISVPGDEDAQLLLMPAWREGQHIGVKLVTSFPGNAQRGMAGLHACYMVFDAMTGTITASLDGTELTLRRTAAASALASQFLSRQDSQTLLMVGTGKLAPHLIHAHSTVRPLRNILVWGRHHERASTIADTCSIAGLKIQAVKDLETAVKQADIISCATSSTDPLIFGRWLNSGQHLDLVGSFTAEKREVDDEALRRSDIYVDTRSGAIKEAGEIIQGLRNGSITESDIKADLFDLCHGRSTGRKGDRHITLFKSVGTALEDLASAQLALRSAT